MTTLTNWTIIMNLKIYKKLNVCFVNIHWRRNCVSHYNYFSFYQSIKLSPNTSASWYPRIDPLGFFWGTSNPNTSLSELLLNTKKESHTIGLPSMSRLCQFYCQNLSVFNMNIKDYLTHKPNFRTLTRTEARRDEALRGLRRGVKWCLP